MKRTLIILAVLYFIVLLVVYLLIHSAANSSWLVTLFLFSPRSIVAFPLLVLVPLTLRHVPKLIWIYGLPGWLIWFPLWGFQWNSGNRTPDPTTDVLSVISCNIGSGELKFETLLELIDQHDVKIVMLQECRRKTSDKLFDQLGWHCHYDRDMAIGSEFPLEKSKVIARQPARKHSVAAGLVCRADCGEFGVLELVSIHLPTFRPGFESMRRFHLAKGSRQINELGDRYDEIAQRLVREVDSSDRPSIIAGDFNVPIESNYYQDYWSDRRNAFSEAGFGFGSTKFTRFHSVRIDHVLLDDSWLILDAWVGPYLGGDHRPVITQLATRPKP